MKEHSLPFVERFTSVSIYRHKIMMPYTPAKKSHEACETEKEKKKRL